MTKYQAALSYLHDCLPMFHRIGPAAYKNSLENTLILDEVYGFPHRKFPTIHIAGTNGKGSVSHMLASVLQSAGYRTGLYTSPHLKDFRERIRINGRMISKREVAEWIGTFRKNSKSASLSPSFFELTVALAFDFFARKKVDIAVIEVGLGGRLDSTNIITPEISVITSISYDHQSLLGDTLQKIAAEKAGIIKEGVPVVIGQWQSEVARVFEQKAAEMNAPLYFAGEEYQAEYGLQDTFGKQVFNFRKNGMPVYPDLRVDLAGQYQRLNIPAVLKTVDLLVEKGWKVPVSVVYKGLSVAAHQTGLRGRWQVLGHNPLIICDTGHNEDGIRHVVDQLRNMAYKHLHIVFGMVSDKDPDALLALLPPEASYYFTKANIPRALNEKELRMKAGSHGLKGEAYPSVSLAFEAARAAAGPHDLIFTGGSNFVVAEIL